MYVGQINKMYLVTKVDVENGNIEIVGLFREKENADTFIEGHDYGEFTLACNDIAVDF